MMGSLNKVVVFAIICISVVHGLPVQMIQKYNYSLQLDNDGKYTVYWAFNDTHITFEVDVETTGWVGFGISPNGQMYPSDVVIGWVNNGQTHFSDRHTTDHTAPIRDASQDWFLLHGEEKDQRTILKFVRKLDTCDKNDIVIGEQTTRLIYSYHNQDPADENSLLYHGPNHRGGKSVSLLSPSHEPDVVKSEDVRIMDFRIRNFEPVITPGNEKYVHHIVFMKCNGSYPELDGKMAVCAGEELDKNVKWPISCQTFGVWAYGGQPFYFPDHVGYPIGNDGYNFFRVQMHYTNLELKTGIIDSSGMRVKLTSHLRQHDAVGLGFAHPTNQRQVVPPGEKAFITRTFCAPQCTLNGLNEEVKVIAGFQHAHLLGAAITTRHFRNGKELEPLMDDPYYDFTFQQFRPLVKERVIKPGDYFVVECTLNSVGRHNATFGGLTTLDEMCSSFVFVYPGQPLVACGSAPTFDNYNFTTNFTDKTEADNLKRIEHEFSHVDWNTPGVREEFHRKLNETTVNHYCVYFDEKTRKFLVDALKYKETHLKPLNRTVFDDRSCIQA